MISIWIDPGHGGEDAGACANGLREKDLNLAISLALKNFIDERGTAQGYLTRSDDRFLTLDERCKLANNSQAGAFISVHCNASPNQDAKGIEVFHFAGSPSGSKLAESVFKALSPLGREGRGVKTADFYVLKNTRIPACLVECGFLTNPAEAAWITQNIRTLAKAIADALGAYLTSAHL